MARKLTCAECEDCTTGAPSVCPVERTPEELAEMLSAATPATTPTPWAKGAIAKAFGIFATEDEVQFTCLYSSADPDFRVVVIGPNSEADAAMILRAVQALPSNRR